MAGLSSPGLGSGLDINSLVTQLVTAEKQTQQTQITRAQTATVTTISALGSLKGSLGTFNASLSALKSVEVFSARSVASSKPEMFTATATNAATAGSYDIEVLDVASAHQLSSNAYINGAAHVVGTGTLTVGIGTGSFQVGIDSTNQTLAGIRDAINSATENNGRIRATIVNATDGAHLVLTAQSTGEASAISIAQSGGNGGLSTLVYNQSLTTNYSQRAEAKDARVSIAGFVKSNSTNTIANAIDGVTLTLLKEDEGEVHKLTITNDTTGAATRIKKFVDEFNALAKQVADLRSFDPATKKGGPLLGDALLRSIEAEVRTKISDPVSGLTGAHQTLASVGITTQKDGRLVVDGTKLEAALNSNFDGVAKLFGSETGVASRMSTALTARLATSGEIESRNKTLTARTAELSKQQVALEARMAKVEARYRAQFSNLDSMLSKLQSTSSFLTQQLSSISKIGSNE
jgi:flagellar hook-associated protein 2